MQPWIKFLTEPSELRDYLGVRLARYLEENNLSLRDVAKDARIKPESSRTSKKQPKIDHTVLSRIIGGRVGRVTPEQVSAFLRLMPDLFNEIQTHDKRNEQGSLE